MRISIANGFEYWDILVDDERLSETLKKLADIDEASVEVLSITNLRSLEDDEAGDVIEQISRSLSMKQKVLVMAYKSGYYEWPRNTSVDELAKNLGVAKSTCLHHLRIGELKVMRKVIEIILRREPHLLGAKK